MPDTIFPIPTVTTGAQPNPRKRHLAGRLHPAIRVPLREIALHPTAGEPPVAVYDSSGPYTDADAAIDIAGEHAWRRVGSARTGRLADCTGQRDAVGSVGREGQPGSVMT